MKELSFIDEKFYGYGYYILIEKSKERFDLFEAAFDTYKQSMTSNTRANTKLFTHSGESDKSFVFVPQLACLVSICDCNILSF